MKNNKRLICIIIVLFLIIIGLLSYIIFEHKNENEKPTNNVTTITTTNNKTTTLYSGDSNGEFNLKIENNKLYEIGTHFELDYDKIDFIDVNTSYNIIMDGYKVKVHYIDGYNRIYVNNKEIAKLDSPELYVLHSLKLINNTLIIRLMCACDIPSRAFAIDLNNNKVLEDVCLPDDSGKCIDYSYEHEDEGFIIETEYALDYNKEVTKYIKNKETFNCDKYTDYKETGCGNNKECERRFPRCFGP